MAEGQLRRSKRIQNRKLAVQLGNCGNSKTTAVIKDPQEPTPEAQLFSDQIEIRSEHESSWRRKSRSTQQSNTTIKRTIIDAKKAAKRAEIKLEAAKIEAKLREQATRLENEIQIKQS